MTIDQQAKTLAPVDWAIIAAYFVLCIAVGLWVSNGLCQNESLTVLIKGTVTWNILRNMY